MVTDATVAQWMGCLAGASTGACPWTSGDGWWLIASVVCAGMALLAARRAAIAARTLRAAALTPRLSRYLSGWVRARSYSDEQFFRADGAGEPWIERRKAGIDRLSSLFEAKHPRSRAWGDAIRDSLSDLRFTDANRVPFPFARVMRERFSLCSVVTESNGPWLRDLDGQWTLDVSGSYGLNVAGFSRYKEWMAKGLERVASAGPGAGTPASRGRREHRDAARRLGPRRGVVPHERHRGGHGRGAAGALQHPAEAHRVLRRRLPRLVGRRAARPGQRAEPRRLPDAQGSPSGVARRHPPARPGDRGRARQSDAVVSPEHAAAERRHPADERRAEDGGVDGVLRPVAAASSAPSATRRGSR